MRLTDSVSLVGGGRLGPGLSNAYDSNVYLVHADDGAWLIDAGSGLEPDRILANATVAAGGRQLAGVAVTHAHADHAGGARAFADRGLRVVSGARTVELIHTADPRALGLDAALRAGVYPDDYVFQATAAAREAAAGQGTLPPGLTAVPTPGHSADHTAYLLRTERTHLFSGDLVFSRGRVAVLATRDCDLQALRASLELVRDLRPDVLLPGHGSPVLSDVDWHLEQAVQAFELGHLPMNIT